MPSPTPLPKHSLLKTASKSCRLLQTDWPGSIAREACAYTAATGKCTNTNISPLIFKLCRSILSRTALVSDLSSKGVVNLVSDEVRQIYSLLEADFTPLELCQRLAPLLEKLETVTESMSGTAPLLTPPTSSAALPVAFVWYIENMRIHMPVRSDLFETVRYLWIETHQYRPVTQGLMGLQWLLVVCASLAFVAHTHRKTQT